MRTAARVLTLASLTVIALATGLGVGLAATATVTIDSTLHPKTLTVAPGTAVTWVNKDGDRHRMRSKDGPVEWDSNDIEPGDSYTFTFTVQGTYPYVDERDDENTAYHGTVIVQASGGESGGGTGGGTGGGGGGTGGGTAAPSAPSTASVRIFDRTFTPSTVTIATGGTVTWTNDDGDEHTVNASAGGFASGTMTSGEKFTKKFASPGTFLYFCAFHSDMRGTVRVQTKTGSVPPPKPSAASGSTGGGGTASGAAAAAPATAPGQSGVAIVDFAFNPTAVRINAGDTVVWANRGQSPHTVTAGDKSFDSGILDPGATYRRVFSDEGSYAYVCSLHPQMSATVLVGAATKTPGAAGSPASATLPPGGNPEGGASAAGAANTASEPGAWLGTGTVMGIVFGIPALLLVGSTIYLRRTSGSKA